MTPKTYADWQNWHGILISGIPKLNIIFSQRQIQKEPPLGFAYLEIWVVVGVPVQKAHQAFTRQK